MTNSPAVYIGETSPEAVAYKLLLNVICAEGKTLGGNGKSPTVDRTYLLTTYAECLEATKGHCELSNPST
jgi:hypothetical protein